MPVRAVVEEVIFVVQDRRRTGDSGIEAIGLFLRPGAPFIEIATT